MDESGSTVAVGAAEVGLRRLLAVVLLPFAIGFFLSNFYRSMNAVLSPRLIADLGLDAGELGLLTAVYFFIAAVCQAPLGMLMDRYGPKRVQGSLFFIAVAGVLVFALGREKPVLILGRAVMGLGAAGALMTSFQAVSLWFPRERWPALNGWVSAAGGLGALAATLPTELILHVTDWRHLMFGTAVVTFVAGIAFFAIVPERRQSAQATSFRAQLKGMATVYRDGLFWRIAPLYATGAGAVFAFQGLWSGPWLKDVAGLSPEEVAGNLLVVTVLQTLNYILMGQVATTLVRRGIRLTQIIGAGSLFFLLLQTALLLPSGAARWAVLVGMGTLGNINLLAYPILAHRFGPELTGRANTALNLFVFLGAFALQYAVGALIDLTPQAAPGRYPAAAYQFAFAIMLALEVASWVWFILPLAHRQEE